MATVTHLISTADTTISPNQSGAFTPTLNSLKVVFVGVSGSTDAAPPLTTSAGGVSYSHIVRAARGTNTSYLHAYVADQLTPSAVSQTVTVTTQGDDWLGSNIAVFEITGVSKAGLLAILQSAIDENKETGNTPQTVFGASALTDNPTLFAVANGTNPATITPPTGWTENGTHGDVGHASPNHGLATSYRDNGFTSTTITAGSTYGSSGSAISLEIDASSAATIIAPNPAAMSV